MKLNWLVHHKRNGAKETINSYSFFKMLFFLINVFVGMLFIKYIGEVIE